MFLLLFSLVLLLLRQIKVELRKEKRPLDDSLVGCSSFWRALDRMGLIIDQKIHQTEEIFGEILIQSKASIGLSITCLLSTSQFAIDSLSRVVVISVHVTVIHKLAQGTYLY